MSYELPRSFHWGCLPALAFVILVGVPTLAGFMVSQSMANDPSAAGPAPLPYFAFIGIVLAIIAGFGAVAAVITLAANRFFNLRPDLSPAVKLLASIVFALALVSLGWTLIGLMAG